MYTKLYFIYYSFLKSKKSFDPTFNAVSVVYLSQVIHFFVVCVFFGKLFGFGVPKFSEIGGTNKMLFLPIKSRFQFYILNSLMCCFGMFNRNI